MTGKAKSTPRVSLAIYRIKDTFQGEVLRSDAELAIDGATTQRLNTDFSELEGLLVIKSPRPKKPSWISFVSTVIPASQSFIDERKSQSAALELHYRKARYVLTFGHGRTLLVPEAIERGFGLRCALDLIPQESMLSIGYKQVNYTTLFSNLQANRRVEFAEFHVDTDDSILSGVVGRPAKDLPRYNKVLGKDALYLNPQISGDEASLIDLIQWVEKCYQTKGYRTRGFDWIDQVAVLTDPQQIAELEKRLDHQLKGKKPPSQLWFGPPGIVDYHEIEELSIQGTRGQKEGEVTLESVRSARGKALSTADLKQAYIWGHDASGQKVSSWRLFEWLNWETSLGDSTVILQGGVYYLEAKSFEARIDERLKTLQPLPDSYPDWPNRKPNERESIYNRKLNKALPGSKFLDEKMFSKSFQGKGKIELCDVLVKRKTAGEPSSLIFVKKYNKTSAPLSHLFAQGMNALDAVLADEGLRAEVRKKVKGVSQIFPHRPPAPSTLAMKFVILTQGERKQLHRLPFFSKLSLFRAAKWAQARGIPLSAGTREMA